MVQVFGGLVSKAVSTLTGVVVSYTYSYSYLIYNPSCSVP